jgi:hypothetical protein
MQRALCPAFLVLLVSACPAGGPATMPAPVNPPQVTPDAGPDVITRKAVVPAARAEPSGPPSARLADVPKATTLHDATAAYFQGRATSRIHIQVDKPLYQPGETVWIKTWDLRTRDFTNERATGVIQYQLVNPKGAIILNKRVAEERGLSTNDFDIPAGAVGGEYLVRVVAPDGTRAERPVVVSSYEAPRIKKKLEFVRKAYGPGDEVNATIEVKRATGEVLGNLGLTAAIRLDGEDLPRVKLTTDDQGNGVVRFMLPQDIAVGDGLLTVLVEDGGITESISRSIPIVLRKVQLTFFPEGGQLVTGLPARIYFEARNTLGKPADVAGTIVDDVGNPVAAFETTKHGLGRLAFTPGTGRTYRAQITRPVGVTETYPVPLAQREGCVMRTLDDVDGELTALRVGVRCSTPRRLVVQGMMRERVLDTAAVAVADGAEALVALDAQDEALKRSEGVARVTVFDEELNPLLERLFFRNRRQGLQVKVEAHRKSYSPRDQVTLAVITTDGSGAPRPAELALSVVDDTVVSLADDKTGHLLSRMLLEPELPGKVEEPNFFFDLTEAQSGVALDLLMGTRGWRRFEWQQVLQPPSLGIGSLADGSRNASGAGRLLEDVAEKKVGRREPAREPRPVDELAKAPAPPRSPPVARADKGPPPAKAKAEKPAFNGDALRDGPAEKRVAKDEMGGAKGRAGMAVMEMAGEEEKQRQQPAKAARARKAPPAMALVRVFPAPSYGADYGGPRTDFRETIHWQPAVRTGKDGRSTVTFYLSDAVTSFRVTTEGAGGTLIGRDETVIQSTLPFSMSAKIPLEVSAGDVVRLPLTLNNERDRDVDIELNAAFGGLLRVMENAPSGQPHLAARARNSVFYPLEVVGKRGQNQVTFTAYAGGLKDEFTREMSVTPLGFPQHASRSGRVDKESTVELDLGEALDGTVEASVRLYASPVATMVSGLEAMLREPSGCFEQASATNYPNVMVMRYLKENNIDDAKLLERSNRLLDSGYKKLVGYETPKRGYEWFGGAPGHEALSAYGLLEFADMKRVYSDVDSEMLARTTAWLKSRRDGKGGYLRDAKALDSFGSASAEVTNAYITYSLVEAGVRDIPEEMEAMASLAANTQDSYLLALATNALLSTPSRKDAGTAAATRLAGMQQASGAWTNANHSITRSGGVNLHIETTALAVMALLKTGTQREATDKGVQWLMTQRGGYGQWGATQATVLALKAMTAYAHANKRTQSPGTVTLLINGDRVATQSYAAGRREPLVFRDLGSHMGLRKNTLTLKHQGSDALPFSVAVDYRTLKPASSTRASVDLRTTLERSNVTMGESVRVNVTLTNKTSGGLPMTLARVGLPGGLTFQNWQLKELKDKGLIGFYETRPREVILYLRDMKPSEVKEIPLDLVAAVPGEYTGPASSAYLYYTNDLKTWVEPLRVSIVQ